MRCVFSAVDVRTGDKDAEDRVSNWLATHDPRWFWSTPPFGGAHSLPARGAAGDRSQAQDLAFH